MSCKTMFHELLVLTSENMPHEKKFDFYSELLQITYSHGINLDMLIGEDPEFDRAYRCFMEV